MPPSSVAKLIGITESMLTLIYTLAIGLGLGTTAMVARRIGEGETSSLNGAGDTWTPTLINLFVFWLWEIPLAFLLAYTLGFGPRGVSLAITIAFSTLAVVSAALFRRGRWKRCVV